MKSSKRQQQNFESVENAQFPKADVLVRAAKLRYLDGCGLKTIAQRLGYKNASSVSRLLHEAHRTGVVRIVIDPTSAINAPRDEGLEAGMMDAFDLDRAIVIRATSESSNNELSQDDQLHVAIANAAGDDLRARVQSGSHIGLGGGRAVYNAVNRLRIRQPRVRDIVITPLTGRLWAHYWDMHGRAVLRPMDADDAAFCLALALENRPGTRFSQIGLPAFAESLNAAGAKMKEHCQFLYDGRWKDSPPSLAVLGVGSLEPRGGHRISDLLRDTPLEIQPYLHAAIKELRSILQDIERLKWGYSPVGDLANRFFPVFPLPDQVASLSHSHIRTYQVLIKKMNMLNGRVIGVRWRHLRQIRHLQVIAGGPHKLNVLWTVLTAPRPFVNELCTDSATARQLLSMADSRKNSLQLDRWLRPLWEKLFVD